MVPRVPNSPGNWEKPQIPPELATKILVRVQLEPGFITKKFGLSHGKGKTQKKVKVKALVPLARVLGNLAGNFISNFRLYSPIIGETWIFLFWGPLTQFPRGGPHFFPGFGNTEVGNLFGKFPVKKNFPGGNLPSKKENFFTKIIFPWKKVQKGNPKKNQKEGLVFPKETRVPPFFLFKQKTGRKFFFSSPGFPKGILGNSLRGMLKENFPFFPLFKGFPLPKQLRVYFPPFGFWGPNSFWRKFLPP